MISATPQSCMQTQQYIQEVGIVLYRFMYTSRAGALNGGVARNDVEDWFTMSCEQLGHGQYTVLSHSNNSTIHTVFGK